MFKNLADAIGAVTLSIIGGVILVELMPIGSPENRIFWYLIASLGIFGLIDLIKYIAERLFRL